MVTDYRLWLLAQIIQRREAIQDLMRVACARAESESDALMPGFTHLQPAQTVRWGHWMMCHATSWQRDDQRLRDMIPRISQLPLGSGALAGNPFLVDRQFLAKVCAVDLGQRFIYSTLAWRHSPCVCYLQQHVIFLHERSHKLVWCRSWECRE